MAPAASRCASTSVVRGAVRIRVRVGALDADADVDVDRAEELAEQRARFLLEHTLCACKLNVRTCRLNCFCVHVIVTDM